MSQIVSLNLPRVTVGAPGGGSGKTFVTASLLSALSSRKIKVAPFKKGPDYIDPKWLGEAAGRSCHNLDYHLFGDKIIESFAKNSAGADMAVIEGNHGIFDSIDEEGLGSTANLARMLGAPVILVVNCRKLSRSVAAIINGFVDFEPDIIFGGVILNQVGGERHEEKLRAAIEKYCRVPVLGCVPHSRSISLEERHIGIVTTEDKADLDQTLRLMGEGGEKYLDLDGIMRIAQSAPPFLLSTENNFKISSISPIESPGVLSESAKGPDMVTIAVARDRAFNFYYPENLAALESEGARLVFFSPVSDSYIPEADAVYLGGGYPEIYAGDLSLNHAVRSQISGWIEEGMPVYAECGGMMYLCKSIDYLGKHNQMTGAIRADCLMTPRPQGRGYVELETIGQRGSGDLWEIPPTVTVHAHEFHFSKLDNFESGYDYAFKMKRGTGISGGKDGLRYKNLLATYSHLHAYAAGWWAGAFVGAAKKFRHQRQ